MKELSKKIRLLRHQRSWSQEDVAKRLKISIPAFSKIETGRTDVNLSRMEELASIFDMSLIQLLTYKESEEQEKLNTDMEQTLSKLRERESELLEMQKKIIELYEELRKVQA